MPIPTRVETRRLVAPAAIAAASVLVVVACASDWDSQTFFPDTFADTYTRVATCRPSTHPKAAYVETWLSPNGAERWAEWKAAIAAGATTVEPFAEGTVLVKAQYFDSDCDDLDNYTAMKKLAVGALPESDDWHWQVVGAEGATTECCENKNCWNCHASLCPDSLYPFVCTQP